MYKMEDCKHASNTFLMKGKRAKVGPEFTDFVLETAGCFYAVWVRLTALFSLSRIPLAFLLALAVPF